MSRTIRDRPTFLAYLRLSGLLSELQMGFVEKHLPADERPRKLARTLVDLGLLTRFQAERLLVGRHAGFVLGQYRILDEIGRGGMGRVFKAEHRTMSRIVALKVLRPDVVADGRGVELFLREVRAAAKLVHPNVVHAYDANEIGGRYFLVLEYVDGPNLSQLVRTRGPLATGLACDYVRQAATGLAAAHAVGMVHRDVKPSNILVQTRGQEGSAAPGLVKVSDFGLARLQTTANPAELSCGGTICLKENTVMGTPDFLSPEQARDLHQTDIRSDLYSLGCTFYFLLTGQVPFAGGTTMEKLIRHSTETPAPLTRLRPETPDVIVAIVDRLLAKDPRGRFQTPTELAQALEPFAVSGPIPWAPPAPPAPLPDDVEGPEDTVAAEGIDAGLLGDGGEFDFDVTGGEDGVALAPTMAPDLLPTPLAPPFGEFPLRRSDPLAPKHEAAARVVPDRKPARNAFLTAAAIVAAVMGIFALLYLLLSGR